MQSNRFYAALPSVQSVTAPETDNSNTLSQILAQLETQTRSIKYLEAQKDAALALGDQANR